MRVHIYVYKIFRCAPRMSRSAAEHTEDGPAFHCPIERKFVLEVYLIMECSVATIISINLPTIKYSLQAAGNTHGT